MTLWSDGEFIVLPYWETMLPVLWSDIPLSTWFWHWDGQSLPYPIINAERLTRKKQVSIFKSFGSTPTTNQHRRRTLNSFGHAIWSICEGIWWLYSFHFHKATSLKINKEWSISSAPTKSKKTDRSEVRFTIKLPWNLSWRDLGGGFSALQIVEEWLLFTPLSVQVLLLYKYFQLFENQMWGNGNMFHLVKLI